MIRGDRPAQSGVEIEITPEMIEAGVAALEALESDVSRRTLVEEVFLAMAAASQDSARKYGRTALGDNS
jgi:hypothetical protein